MSSARAVMAPFISGWVRIYNLPRRYPRKQGVGHLLGCDAGRYGFLEFQIARDNFRRHDHLTRIICSSAGRLRSPVMMSVLTKPGHSTDTPTCVPRCASS